jgi:uncharacterized membrane protein YfcA
MGGLIHVALVFIAAFAGALVSGLVGFAFSAVAGAILLHMMPPTEAVPLMMLCSILVQLTSLIAIIDAVRWKQTLVFAAGGLLGVVPAIYLLQHADTKLFRIGFGIFVASYAAYMMLRSAAKRRPSIGGSLGDGLVGVGGGLIGGLTAMPGALPTMWCDLHGLTKLEQRGAVQPFIMIMQFVALALLLPQVGYSPDMLFDFVVSAPGLAAGTVTGVVLFGRVDDATFRRVVLTALLVSGLMLVL